MERRLPKSLKGFAAYVDGYGFLGRLAGGALPKVKIKTEEHRDGGMDGATDLDFGLEKMEASLTFSEYDRNILKSVGRRDVPITLRGSAEDESGASEAIVASLRGLILEGDPGEWKAGEPKVEAKLNMTPDFYRLTIGDEEIYEIDVLGCVRRIGGVDQLAQRRANLGA